MAWTYSAFGGWKNTDTGESTGQEAPAGYSLSYDSDGANPTVVSPSSKDMSSLMPSDTELDKMANTWGVPVSAVKEAYTKAMADPSTAKNWASYSTPGAGLVGGDLATQQGSLQGTALDSLRSMGYSPRTETGISGLTSTVGKIAPIAAAAAAAYFGIPSLQEAFSGTSSIADLSLSGGEMMIPEVGGYTGATAAAGAGAGAAATDSLANMTEQQLAQNIAEQGTGAQIEASNAAMQGSAAGAPGAAAGQLSNPFTLSNIAQSIATGAEIPGGASNAITSALGSTGVSAAEKAGLTTLQKAISTGGTAALTQAAKGIASGAGGGGGIGDTISNVLGGATGGTDWGSIANSINGIISTVGGLNSLVKAAGLPDYSTALTQAQSPWYNPNAQPGSGGRTAADQLQGLIKDPTSIYQSPLFTSNQALSNQALERQYAAKGQGISGGEMSAMQNQNMALGQDYYNKQVANLTALSGAGFNPAQGVTTAGQTATAGINAEAEALKNVTSGISGIAGGIKGLTSPTLQQIMGGKQGTGSSTAGANVNNMVGDAAVGGQTSIDYYNQQNPWGAAGAPTGGTAQADLISGNVGPGVNVDNTWMMP